MKHARGQAAKGRGGPARGWRWSGDRLTLSIRVQPRARRDEVVGFQGDFLKVKVSAPPVDGKANDSVLRLLAKELGVSPRCVRLTSGAASREKRVVVDSPTVRPHWLIEANVIPAKAGTQ